ncbi:MAG: hypothetical protein JWM16_6343 [Verrucomicrobiales bacterium]|nr:hypothetical protein [Verrucomicrobiales bacterium]
MANAYRPDGLSPVSDLNGRPWNGAGRIMSTTTGDGTAIGIGDPVLALGTSTTWPDGTVTKDVKIAATTDVIEGVVIGVLPDTRDSTIYRAASTARRLLVCDDPNVLFEISDGNSGTPIPAADIGLNCSLSIGSPSTTTGRSGCILNNTTQQTTNTLAVRIIGAVPRPDNEVGALAQRFLVRINRHRYVDQVAGL